MSRVSRLPILATLAGIGVAFWILGRARPPDPVPEPVAGRPVVAPAARSRISRGTTAQITGQTARIEGRVVDPLGLPIPRASVEARGPDAAIVRGASGADGRFAIEVRGGRAWALRIHHELYAERPPLRGLFPQPGQRLSVGDVVLASGLVVEGRVLSEGRVAVPRARVTVRPELGHDFGPFAPSPRETTTDTRGEFRVTGLEPGLYRVHVHPPEPWADADLGPTPATEAGRTRLEIVVGRGYPLVGRVLRADGSPAPLCRVALFEDGASEPKEAQSDPRGGFRFDRIRKGPALLRALAGGTWVPFSVEATCRVPAPGPVLLRLPRGEALLVRIDGGPPAPGALEVACCRSGSPPETWRRLTLRGRELWIEGLPPGHYDVWVRGPRHLPVRATGCAVPGPAISIPLRSGRTITVEVRDPDGRERPGLTLRALAAAEAARMRDDCLLAPAIVDALAVSAVTGADGRAELGPLPDEPVIVFVRERTRLVPLGIVGPGRRTATLRDPAPTGELVIGAPPRHEVVVEHLEIPFRVVRTVPEGGIVRLPSLPEGPYRIGVAGLKLPPREWSVRAGTSQRIDFR